MSDPNPIRPNCKFIEALTRNQPVLEAFCHANIARREDAWEVLQETNLKLWKKAADWDPDTDFLPWAFTVARFTILSHFRDQSRDRLVFDSDVMEAMASEAEAAANELPERRQALGKCLQKLNQDQQTLLRQHYLDGIKLRDIAAATRRGESALKMVMLRIRRALSDCIQNELGKAQS